MTLIISIIVTTNIPVWSLQNKGDNSSRDGLSSDTCSCWTLRVAKRNKLDRPLCNS